MSYGIIGESTIGIAFFGTPHQGSRLAPIGDVFANVVRANPKESEEYFYECSQK